MADYSVGGFGRYLDWDANEVAPNASGLAVPIFDENGEAAIVTAGSARQALRVNAAGTGLEFGGSGTTELIEHKTLSASSSPVTFSTGITGYKYLILAYHLTGGATSNGTLSLRFNNDSGANYSHKTTSSNLIVDGSSATSIKLGFTLQTNTAQMGYIVIAVEAESSSNFHSVTGNAGGLQDIFLGGNYASASDITRVDLIYSGTGGSNTLTGEATLYGITTS